ncbi:hypothetical protein LAZ67_2005514 [Cordylochernes scorpioides]|uniref:Mos1 transposase HTH domain-containing protein n=1 Tax=Cordylochernes scorpioides TaxID=51811 RepID=A0ABY6K7Q9_9ARAC|nr:hypothetical protein LAZ67_2005514 [Cordylochernes scorpioides]
MDSSIEQRYAIEFCFRLGKTASETFAMITEAYKEDALSRAQVFRWFNEFKNGRESVKELLDFDYHLSLKMIADEVSVNKFTVHQIVTQDLMMRNVCAKLVPRVLTAKQKQRRVDVCREMLNELKNNPDFLDNVVTGDESWTFHYDPETKAQSSEWHKPPYSPVMSPPDFFLFPKVKRCLKGHHFDDIANIQRSVTKALTGITPTDYYSGAYEAWKMRWQRCVDAQGEFFEEY